MEKQNKINTLQGLRFIAFVCIFLWHLNGYMGIKMINLAGIAVTFFFMLSGFVSELTMEKYLKNNKDKNILKQSLNYAKNKMSKIYILYLITLFLYVPFSIKHLLFEYNISIYFYIILFILNILFLNSWFKYYMDISFVGWYLSDLFFLNFLSVMLSKFIKNVNKINSLLIDIFLVFISFFGLFIYSNVVPNKGFYFYFFPLFRIFEYFIGMCLYNIYSKLNNYLKNKNYNFIFTLIEFLCVFIIIFYLYPKSINLNYGFNISALLIVMNLFILLIFSLQKGLLSKLLSLKLFVILGNISGEMYLIHFVIISYVLGILQRIFPNNIYFVIISCIFIFLLTVLISYIIHYKKYENIINKFKTKIMRSKKYE